MQPESNKKTAKHPLFSIITVCYNSAPQLKKTLESIAEQKYQGYEHIVIDGASTDNTLDVHTSASGKERRKFFSEPDDGLYDAMNKGIGKATGDYLIFLNAGDKFHSPETLGEYAETIAKNNFPGIVYGQTNLVDAEGRYLAPRHLAAPANLTYKSFANGMLVCHQAFVVLRRIAPLFNLKYHFSADYDWCIQCLQHSQRNVYTGSIVIDYLSEGLSTANRRRSLIERFNIMSHYYGFLPTAVRHLSFIGRFLNHRKKMKSVENKYNK